MKRARLAARARLGVVAGVAGVAGVAAVAAASGCVFDVTPTLDGLACQGQACVDGFTCVGGLCIADADVPAPVELQGAFDKGPFVVGSTIRVDALDAAGAPTGQVFFDATDSNRGDFTVPLQVRGLVNVEGNGAYYNEALGRLSIAPLTLRALYVVDDGAAQPAFVNLITHLARDRAAALLVEGLAVDDAIAQAEQELVVAVGVGVGGPGGDGSDVALVGPFADAYLLALSAVVAQAAVIEAGGPNGPVDAQLQELVNTIALDLADDGAIAPALRAQLDAAEAQVDVDLVLAGLRTRLDEIGSEDELPELGDAVDEDNDAVPHTGDNCVHVVNPGQEDSDVPPDGVGDACDCGNGVIDVDNGEQCDGAALPTDPPPPPGAVCTPDCRVEGGGACSADGENCDSDDNCCPGLECGAAFTCLDLRCSAIDEPCSNAPDCCPGATCDIANFRCVDDGGGCAIDGAGCAVDGDCCSGDCDAAGTCTPGQCAPLNGACVVSTDCCNGNCIGNVCGCPAALDNCGGVCVDTNNDENFCGNCTNQCNAGQFCMGGSCVGGGAQCGNNVAEGSERCDGTDLRGETCASLGFPGGVVLSCDPNCNWALAMCSPQTEQCNGVDDDGDTLTDECCDAGGQCGSDIGQCQPGLLQCNATVSGTVCNGAVTPAAEACNGLDDDCDGIVDEDCGGTVCTNGIDDDGDGVTDLADPGCAGAADNNERGTTACDDGLDNDNDGRTDFSTGAVGDPGCTGPDDLTERGTGACDDGVDNDGDSFADFNVNAAVSDPGCSSPSDPDETGENGSVCTSAAQCASALCVDGFCCNASCSGTCQTCAATPAGVCTFHPVGTDPDGECPGAQLCNGSGSCQ